MFSTSSVSRQKSWQTSRTRVSVLAEMALRREKVVRNLIEIRERNGLTQEDAAHKVGVTVRQWQRWEAGESMPYPRNLDLIASKFGTSVADFFDEEPSDGAPVQPPTNLADELGRIHGRLDRIEGLLRDASVEREVLVDELKESIKQTGRAASEIRRVGDAMAGLPQRDAPPAKRARKPATG